MRTKFRCAAPLASGFLAALLLAGCGASDGSGTATGDGGSSAGDGTAQPTPDARSYAGCMRDNGVEMSDPDPATGLAQFADSVDPSSPAVQAAMAACQDLLPTDARGGAAEQDLDDFLAFSACMRENGMADFPDPRPGPDGMFGDSGIDREDPAYQQAAAACADVLRGE